jgi:hypothetical protein
VTCRYPNKKRHNPRKPVTQAANLDLFIDRGGKGQNTTGGVYGPQELIKIYASVTYRNSPVLNKDVTFSICNSKGDQIAVRVGRTDSSGNATAEFRLPWSDTTTPESVFGTWSILATVDLSESTLNDTVPFNYNYIVTANGIQVPAVVQKLDNVKINVTVDSLSDTPLWTSLSLTVYDEQRVPIACYTVTNTNQAKGSSPVTATITIPSWAFPGQATVYVNILTNTLDNGGVPYNREKTANFQIE